jgi:hypothetical protein
VNNEVEPVETQDIDGRIREPAESGPGVVEIVRAIGKTEPG